MNLSENLFFSVQLVVKFVVAVRCGQECIAIRDEQIENVDNLKQNQKSTNTSKSQKSITTNLHG